MSAPGRLGYANAEKGEEPVAAGKNSARNLKAVSDRLRKHARKRKSKPRRGPGRTLLALRYRFEAEELLAHARTRRDHREDLAKLALSRSYTPEQHGLTELIERAKQGQRAATK